MVMVLVWWLEVLSNLNDSVILKLSVLIMSIHSWLGRDSDCSPVCLLLLMQGFSFLWKGFAEHVECWFNSLVASYGHGPRAPWGAQCRKVVTALAEGLEIPFADVSPSSLLPPLLK